MNLQKLIQDVEQGKRVAYNLSTGDYGHDTELKYKVTRMIQSDDVRSEVRSFVQDHGFKLNNPVNYLVVEHVSSHIFLSVAENS